MIFKFRGNTYQLERTAHCFMISKMRFNEKKQKEEFDVLSYHHDLNSCFKQLFNLHVLDKSEHQSLVTCVKEINEELKHLLRSDPFKELDNEV